MKEGVELFHPSLRRLPSGEIKIESSENIRTMLLQTGWIFGASAAIGFVLTVIFSGSGKSVFDYYSPTTYANYSDWIYLVLFFHIFPICFLAAGYLLPRVSIILDRSTQTLRYKSLRNKLEVPFDVLQTHIDRTPTGKGFYVTTFHIYADTQEPLIVNRKNMETAPEGASYKTPLAGFRVENREEGEYCARFFEEYLHSDVSMEELVLKYGEVTPGFKKLADF